MSIATSYAYCCYCHAHHQAFASQRANAITSRCGASLTGSPTSPPPSNMRSSPATYDVYFVQAIEYLKK